MKQRNGLPGWILKSSLAGWIFFIAAPSSLWGQEGSPPAGALQGAEISTTVRELQEQVRELRAAVAEVRSEAAQYRAETVELRHALEKVLDRERPTGPPIGDRAPSAMTGSANPGADVPRPERRSLAGRVDGLEDSTQLINGKIDEQYQTKVESASKYHVRLSGIVLMDLFSNRGSVDNQDVPSIATAPTPASSDGTFGASLRQSEIGLEVFGPKVGGARTSGELSFDFSGGFPNTLNGANYGLVRLRTGSIRMDWGHTAIVVGQDPLFLSPLSPSSFASLSTPAFSYSGNLWGWLPQARVEHQFDLSEEQKFLVQGGIIDNFAGEPPYSSIERIATAGEKTSQPAYGTRVAWTRKLHGQPLTLGAAGYYGRQNWSFDRYSDGWAGMADLEVPISSRVIFSSELYRGRAIGGLGGGDGRSVVFSGPVNLSTSSIRGINTAGGWSQLKLKVTPKLEFNGAFGLDNPFAGDLRAFPSPQSYYNPQLAQNRSAMLNLIYRPRSNLVFSTEYRHLRTFQANAQDHTAERVNLVMGIMF